MPGASDGQVNGDERFEIALLGRFEVRRGGQLLLDSSWSRRKAQALLKLLAVRVDHTLHRDELLDHLWPELEPAAANNNLHKNLHYIRAALAARGCSRPLVMLRAEMVELAPGVAVDADRFKELAQAALAAGSEDLFRQAAALYRGDLLPEDAYEDWTQAERDEARRLYAELLLGLARLREAQGRLPEAIETLNDLLRSDQLNEEAHRLLMLLYARSGSRHRSLRQYQVLRDLLSAELQIAPSPATQHLFEQLLAGGVATEQPQGEKSETAPDGQAAAVAAVAAPSRTFGRDRELDRAEAVLENALNGRGTTLFVRGEAGIGKSHLVGQLLASAAESGAAVLSARCYGLESSVAYQPFRDLLRQVAASPSAGDFLGRSIYLRNVLLGAPEGSQAARHPRLFQSELFDELLRLLQAMSRRQPVVVWLDDLHDVDEDSIRLLHFLARRIAGERVLLVATYRTEEPDRRGRLTELLASLRREHQPTEVELGPLDNQAMTLLVESLLGGSPVDPPLLQEILSRAEGNPFFAAEIVHTFVQEGWARRAGGRWERRGSGQAPVPSAVQDLLDIRLGRLSAAAHDLLQLMAAFGREIDYSVLRRTSALPERQALDALDECLDALIIEETAEGGYRFRHDLLREAIYGRLTRARRQLLHKTLAEALLQASPEPLSGPHVEAIAHHLSLGDEPERALPYLVESGRRAAGVFANEQAVALYERALDVARSRSALQPAALAALEEGLGDVEVRRGNAARAVELFQAAHSRFGESGEVDAAVRTRSKAALGNITLGNVQTARDLIAATLQDINERSPMMVVARTYYLLAQLPWHSGENRQALEAAERALAAADTAGDPTERARAIEAMALACHSLGDWQRGVELELQRQTLGVPGFDTDEAFEAHL